MPQAQVVASKCAQAFGVDVGMPAVGGAISPKLAGCRDPIDPLPAVLFALLGNCRLNAGLSHWVWPVFLARLPADGSTPVGKVDEPACTAAKVQLVRGVLLARVLISRASAPAPVWHHVTRAQACSDQGGMEAHASPPKAALYSASDAASTAACFAAADSPSTRTALKNSAT